MKALGAWCGAWQAPGANHMKNGLSAEYAAQILEVADGAVGQVFGQVVPLGGRAGWPDLVVVGDEIGVVLVGLAREESVVARRSPSAAASGRAGRRAPSRAAGVRCHFPTANVA